MAYTEKVCVVSLPAGADLTGANNEAVTLNASGQVVKADAATEKVYGVISSAPVSSAVGSPVGVALVQGGGVLKVKASAAITAGHSLIPTTTAGKVAGTSGRPSVAGQQSFGIALEAATAADEIISFLAHTQDSAT